MLVNIEVLGRTISTYGLMAVLGVCVAVGYGYLQVRKAGLLKEDYFFMLGYGLIGAMIGAKLLYQLPRLPELWEHGDLIFANMASFTSYLFSGFVFYGGLIGLFIGLFLYAKEFHIDIKPYIILLIPAIPLFHAFGRIGCFLSGCCYGVETDAPFGITYHSVYADPQDAMRFPVQLVEAAGNMILFFCLHMYGTYGKHRSRTAAYYMIAYATMRFILEWLRGDMERGIYLLSISQWVSILLLLLGGYLIAHPLSKDVEFNHTGTSKP